MKQESGGSGCYQWQCQISIVVEYFQVGDYFYCWEDMYFNWQYQGDKNYLEEQVMQGKMKLDDGECGKYRYCDFVYCNVECYNEIVKYYQLEWCVINIDVVDLNSFDIFQ